MGPHIQVHTCIGASGEIPAGVIRQEASWVCVEIVCIVPMTTMSRRTATKPKAMIRCRRTAPNDMDSLRSAGVNS